MPREPLNDVRISSKRGKLVTLKTPTTFSLLATVVIAAALLAPLGAAHVTKDVGPSTIKVGWTDEPAASGARNHVFAQIWNASTGAGIPEATKTLTFTVKYSDQSKTLDMTESDEESGNYTAPLLMSKPGIYVIHVEGTLQGKPIKQDFDIEDVTDGNADIFPATIDLTAQLKDLQDRVSALEAKAKTSSETPAPVTSVSPSKGVPALGLVAALGIVSLAALLMTARRRF